MLMKLFYIFVIFAFNSLYAMDGVIRVKDVEGSVAKISQIYKIISNLEKISRDSFAKKKDAIQSKYDKLNTNKASIAQETFVKEMQKLEKEYNTFQSEVQKKMQEIDFIKSKILNMLTLEVNEATRKISSKKGLEKVFGDHFLMYYDQKTNLDITDEVVAEINKSFSSTNPAQLVEKLQKEFISK